MIDAKIKEKIDDAKIVSFREQFRKQCTILLILLCEINMLGTANSIRLRSLDIPFSCNFGCMNLINIIMSKSTTNFFPKETEVNNRLSMSSHRHSCLVKDHFLFEGGWGGGWLANTKTKFLHSICRGNKNRV